MRVLHVTNLVSPHQMPLARQLAAAVGDRHFRYVATLPMIPEMQKRGWKNETTEPWVLLAGEDEHHRAQFEQWWDKADVVIAGDRRMARFADRVRCKKLTFFTSERWWKPPLGMARLLHPRFAWMAARFCRLAQSSSFHYLPMGGYASADMRRIAAFCGRMWNWGYFTDVPDPLPPCLERDEPFRVLWAGRMLSWKRVDTLLRAFALLRQRNSKVRLTLIGHGPCQNSLKRLAQKLGVADDVDFHSSMLAPQVRHQMRNAHVYVLPSNPYEGWGAVLNEAMSEGCAVVASEAVGSAKVFLRDGENGLLFAPGNYRQLGELLVQLSMDEPSRHRLAKAGQRTIAEDWSPKVASEHFLSVCDALLSNRPVPHYSDGPMTPA